VRHGAIVSNVVYGNYLYINMIKQQSEQISTDAPKAINGNFCFQELMFSNFMF
jgi:hypothetical protein